MFRHLLTKKFFRENPYKEISTQRFVYRYLTNDGIEELARDLVLTEMGLMKERLEKIAREKEMIESEGNPEEIFQLLRKNVDVYEIDLIAISPEETVYIQVVATVRDENTLKRELRPLMLVKDHHPKMILTLADNSL